MRCSRNLRHHPAQLLCRIYRCILVWGICHRSKCTRKQVRFHFADHSRCSSNLGCRHDRRKHCIKQRALPLHRSLFLLSRLHSCHIGKLHLWGLLRNRGILHRCDIIQICQEALEIQLGKQSPQLINLRRADRQILLSKLYRHIEANGCQHLCQAQLLLIGEDISPRFTSDFIGIGDNIFNLAPRLHHLACALLADSRNTRNVIGRVAP